MKQINKAFIILVLLFPLFSTNIMGQDDNIGAAVAEDRIKNLYRDLSSYALDANTHGGDVNQYTTIRNRVLDFFTGQNAVINMDIRQVVGGDRTEEVHINSYLIELDRIASTKVINFKPSNFDGFIDEKNGVRFFLCSLQVFSDVQSSYYYTCKARVGFKGKKICSIKYYDFRLPQPPPPPIVLPSHMFFTAGWKITNGVSIGVGIDGISKNWFINHLRFGVEYNMLFNQERDSHYPTSSDGTSSTMTYRTRENDDYGLGINIGYRIIPGKYDNVSILGGPVMLFFSMGGGIIRYGRWWEYQGTAEPIKHPRNTAFYIKPSLTLEYLLSDFWGIGIEASYYYSPQYSQINGVGFNAIINYAF